jgi:hypothetical protein
LRIFYFGAFMSQNCELDVRKNKGMPKATERSYISYPGEYYDDAWTVEAALKGRTKTAEGSSLLCAKLQERESRRNQMVQYLANKRNISFEEMWNQLLVGDYEPITPVEFKKIQEMMEPED